MTNFADMELTTAIRKGVRALGEVKHRRQQQAFVAEGSKCVCDMLPYFDCRLLVATATWANSNPDIFARYHGCVASRADMERMTLLSTPPQVLAVFNIPQLPMPSVQTLSGELVLALDCVQDPGNLGTIIRVADWMGVHNIIASKDTVDVYNPKVVQATMGSLARVNVCYTDLSPLLEQLKGIVPVYGTLLDRDAQDIFTTALPDNAVLVMGNEGKGISADVRKHLTHTLFIPPYPVNAVTAESLNVAVATAITLSQFRFGINTDNNGKDKI